MDTSLYKPLLYIRKNYEESYIELYGLNITENSKLVYKGNILQESYWAKIVGNTDLSGSSDNFSVNIYNNRLIGNCGRTLTEVQLSSDFNINNIIEIEFTGNSYFKVNNQIIDNTSKSTSFSRRSLYICGGNSTGNLKSVQQYIYRTKLYEDGTTLSYDFIPCKRLSDNVVGMYDKVHDRFYPPTQGTFYEPIIMDDIKFLTIPEGNVTKIEDNEGRVLWSALLDSK